MDFRCFRNDKVTPWNVSCFCCSSDKRHLGNHFHLSLRFFLFSRTSTQVPSTRCLLCAICFWFLSFRHPQLLLLPSSNAPADTSISLPHSQTQCQYTEPLWSLRSVGYMAVSSPNFCPLRSLGLLPILIPILILFLNFVEYTTLRNIFIQNFPYT